MKTTLKHYRIFKKEVERLGKMLLPDFVLFIRTNKDKKNNRYIAFVRVEPNAKQAIIDFVIGTDMIKELSSKELHNIALHELLHVLFWKITSSAESISAMDATTCLHEEHGIINKIINLKGDI